MNGGQVPTIVDVRAAAGRLANKVQRTPLLEFWPLNERAGGRVFLKLENLQHTGSFKFRGAYNFICQLEKAERARGVVAYSSGNHAQGVAAAARLLSAQATIVMPSDAPQIKLDNTKALGARVVTYDRKIDVREDMAQRIADETGATIVPPYDHPWTIAGQGTVGLEIAAQTAEKDVTPDAVLIPCGGGGLTAGTSLAVKDLAPRTEIMTVEPAHYDDTARSLAAGALCANESYPPSLCDALLAPKPGEITFAVNRRLVTRGLAVGDKEVAAAMAFAFASLKLVVEPGGAVALAAILAGIYDCHDKIVVAVISGGNVDRDLFANALSQGN